MSNPQNPLGWHALLMMIAEGLDDVDWPGYAEGVRGEANKALADNARLRSLVGELVDVVVDQREKLIDHTNLYDPRFDGDEPDAQVVALIAKAKAKEEGK